MFAGADPCSAALGTGGGAGTQPAPPRAPVAHPCAPRPGQRGARSRPRSIAASGQGEEAAPSPFRPPPPSWLCFCQGGDSGGSHQCHLCRCQRGGSGGKHGISPDLRWRKRELSRAQDSSCSKGQGKAFWRCGPSVLCPGFPGTALALCGVGMQFRRQGSGRGRQEPCSNLCLRFLL